MSDFYDWDHYATFPCGLYDVAANETWLEEKAAQGYHVQRTLGSRVYFEKGEPSLCRYRLQPLTGKEAELDDERLALYRNLGWQHMGAVGGLYHLWRCADPHAPELDTDPVVQAEGYRRQKECMVRTALLELGFLVGLIAICILANTGGGTALRYILRSKLPLESLALLGALGSTIAWEAMEVRTMLRLLKTLRSGIPLERPRPYRTKQRIRRGMAVVFGLWVILQGVSSFWPVGNRDILGWDAMGTDGKPKTGIVYMDATAMDPPEDAVDFDHAFTKVHELARRVTEVEMRQLRHVRPGYNLVAVNAETTHYDLRWSFLVPILVEDIQAAYRNWGPFVEVQAPGLDRFWVSTRKNSQVAIAVKGNEVLEVFYTGGADLAARGDYFAGLLA